MIKKNDVLKSKEYPWSRKVLEVVGDLYAISALDDFDIFGHWLTLSELERDYAIPESKWEPKMGETVWYVTSNGDIEEIAWAMTEWNFGVRNFLGVYQNESLAEQALAEIKRKIKE